jgi:hypothetical protein
MRRSFVGFALLAITLTGCGGNSSTKLATQPGAGTYPSSIKQAMHKFCEQSTSAGPSTSTCECVIQHIEEVVPASQVHEDSSGEDSTIAMLAKTDFKICEEASG